LRNPNPHRSHSTTVKNSSRKNRRSGIAYTTLWCSHPHKLQATVSKSFLPNFGGHFKFGCGFRIFHFKRNRRTKKASLQHSGHESRQLRYTALLMAAITTLDNLWIGHPYTIAAALVESNGHRAIVDPGPGSTLETLRKQLQARGLSVRDLDALLLTHIHLDHAGASGALVRENPRLAVYVHKNGAPHMADPSKLLASALRLWPNDLHRLFGEMLPVPAENLRILEGGETLKLGSSKFEVVYTPGHASHHVSYFDHQQGVAFVGDTAGVGIEGQPYVMPATPPPDIDLEIWESSFKAILERKPSRLFLTHFGFSGNPGEHIFLFRERLHKWADIAAKSIRSASEESAALAAFMAETRAEIAEHLPAEEVEHYVFSAGLNLSFLGLARYLRKRAAAAS
jgi:glyoxylase-like metal-dependent hydrolase (beta-lactamase superfamily II)